MIPCTCFVQSGQTADQKSAMIQSRLQKFAESAFGSVADINWITVPAGGGFTAAKPSTSSIVTFDAAEPVDQDVRVTLLEEICDLWMSETGCEMDEVIAVINDPKT